MLVCTARLTNPLSLIFMVANWIVGNKLRSLNGYNKRNPNEHLDEIDQLLRNNKADHL